MYAIQSPRRLPRLWTGNPFRTPLLWPELTLPQADGCVVIFDLETNGVARKLTGHTRQVQSLSWSANDRYLLSASQDWRCVLWDLKDGRRIRTVRFGAPVFIAELHPRNQ